MSIKERIQARLAPAIMKLPDRVLAKMAGDPVVVDGRTLDVRLQLMAAQSADAPSITDLDPITARSATAASFAQANSTRAAGVSAHDVAIDSTGLTVRIYRPAVAVGSLPAMLFMHQGGYVIGDLDTCDSFCSRVADDLGGVVVSLHYRLAPEHRFPAAAEDASAAWVWMNHNAVGLGIDPDRMVVCGDSAGGQMAAALCQSLRDAGAAQPALQVLVYPFVDATAIDGSMASCADAFPLTSDTMEWFSSYYLPVDLDRGDPSLSPALADSVGDVAPAIVVTAGFDPLRDQGIAFALALRAAGVAVTDRCENSLSHSFLAFDGLVPEASDAIDRIIADVARHLRP